MAWETEMTLIVRTLISDLADPPTYSDSRIQQVILVAGNYVQQEANLPNQYTIDITASEFTPDPTELTPQDTATIGLVCLKAACILDQSTFRTRVALEGIRTTLGSSSLHISGNLTGYKLLLDQGPCAMYEQLLQQWNIGNATAVAAILSPFVGNTFDPTYIGRAPYIGNPKDIFG